MPNTPIVKYVHHGLTVSVRDGLRGKHREHCLCYTCKKFENCRIATQVFMTCCQFGIVTPVWECPKYTEE